MGCGICGEAVVEIRGRYPNTERRKVCPTCLAERMDQIRDVSSSTWGQAAQAFPEVLQISPNTREISGSEAT